MRRETNNDRQQRLFVTGLLISAVVGALIGLLWPLWFPADSACETTIPDASFCAHPCYGRHPAAGGGGRCHEDLLPDL